MDIQSLGILNISTIQGNVTTEKIQKVTLRNYLKKSQVEN